MRRLLLCGILAAWLSSQQTALQAGEAPRSDAKPNIVFILADDISYRDLGCFGQKYIQTPHLDKLAANGLVCTNAYAGGSWCAPSRTSLLTGLRPDHWSRQKKVNPTVAEVLKAAGYATGVFGKWHVVDAENTLPAERGFDTALVGYMVSHRELASPNLNKMNPYFPMVMVREDGEQVSFPENRNVDDEYVWSYGSSAAREPARTRLFDAEGRFKDKTGSIDVTYAEDVYRREALAFLRSKRDQPFLLLYATPLPHSPIGVKNLGRFREVPSDWNLDPGASTTFPRLLWAAMIEELDRSVGMLLDELKTLGIEKNTLVIFAADNGYACWGNWNTGGRWVDDDFFQHKGPWHQGKFANSHGGVIVPFIVSWPGMVAAGTSDRALSFYDFVATAADLAGEPLSVPTDGISLLPILQGRASSRRSELVFPREGGGSLRGTIPSDSMLLDERWFATCKSDEAGSRSLHLFDIQSDPGCRFDLSAVKPELADRALSIAEELQSRRKAR